MSNGWAWINETKRSINHIPAELGPEWKPLGYVTEDGMTHYKYETKDSGAREERPSGYVRDTQKGKPRFDLLLADGVPYSQQFLTRFAELLARGSEKYGDRNWELADDEESLDRFQSSALRHMMQWMNGEEDEDHAAAVAYNLFAYESTLYKMEAKEAKGWH